MEIGATHGSQPDHSIAQIEGLSAAEVALRRDLADGTAGEEGIKASIRPILRKHLFTIFNIDLVGLVSLQLLFGRVLDALVSAAVMFFAILFGVGQEVWAWWKLSRLAEKIGTTANVIREGQLQEISISAIVDGDVLVVGPGDRIVADGVTIRAESGRVDESALTSSTQAAVKSAGDDVYAGSLCLSGRIAYEAKGVAIASFSEHRARQMKLEDKTLSPLQKLIDRLLRLLLLIVVYFSALLIVTFFMQSVSNELLSSLAGMVFSIAPSGLFLMILVAYAVGAAEIANKGALVPELTSIESLGQVTTLCLTSTGILTGALIRMDVIENTNDFGAPRSMSDEEIRQLLGDYARSLAANNVIADVVADAFAGERLSIDEQTPFLAVDGWSAITINDQKRKGTFVLGDPTILQPNLKDDESAEAGYRLAGKGLLTHFIRNSRSFFRPDNRTQTNGDFNSEAGSLLFAYRDDLVPLHDELNQPKIPDNLTPLCLLHFSREIHRDAREVLAWLADNRVQLRVVSSSSVEDLFDFASQTGIENYSNQPVVTMTGSEVGALSGPPLGHAVAGTTVFGSLTGDQKGEIVKALQDQGHHVAVVGDSLDDLRALRQANLSIAMRRGNQAIHSLADIVLLDDSLTTLQNVFSNGLKIVNGLVDVFKLYLTRIVAFIFIVLTLSVLDIGTVHTGRQASLIMLATVLLPSIVLTLTAKSDVVTRSRLAVHLGHFVIPAGVLTAIAGIATYMAFFFLTYSESYAQLTLTYTLIICGLLLVIFVRPPIEIVGGKPLPNGDWFPTITIIVLGSLFAVLAPTQLFALLFDITILREIIDYVIVGAVAAVWATCLFLSLQGALLERYLRIRVVNNA